MVYTIPMVLNMMGIKRIFKKVTNALKYIYSTEEGKSMINELQNSTNSFTIVRGNSKFNASNLKKHMQIKFKQIQMLHSNWNNLINLEST